MNNPLAQKYNYYLNESHRLNEELKSEEAYSELLENVLFELLGEEDFTRLFEYVLPASSYPTDRRRQREYDRRQNRERLVALRARDPIRSASSGASTGTATPTATSDSQVPTARSSS